MKIMDHMQTMIDRLAILVSALSILVQLQTPDGSCMNSTLKSHPPESCNLATYTATSSSRGISIAGFAPRF